MIVTGSVIEFYLFIYLFLPYKLTNAIISKYAIKLNPYYPNFNFFHKNLRFGVLLSVDNHFAFKNSKKYVLMVPGPKC